jgi:hypothetical protein
MPQFLAVERVGRPVKAYSGNPREKNDRRNLISSDVLQFGPSDSYYFHTSVVEPLKA